MLVVDGLPQLLSHLGPAPVLAAPLLLIGLAYVALQPLAQHDGVRDHEDHEGQPQREEHHHGR